MGPAPGVPTVSPEGLAPPVCPPPEPFLWGGGVEVKSRSFGLLDTRGDKTNTTPQTQFIGFQTTPPPRKQPKTNNK